MIDEDEGVPHYYKHSKICFLSNFPPKECGIATFTKDLVNAMDKSYNAKLKSQVIALNEETDFYNYDHRVVMQINKEDIEDYIIKAKEINKSNKIKIVSIQHEFGIFGGEHGSYLIPFLETIEKPVVITFHSVLPNPDKKRKKIVKFLGDKSAKIIVMANSAIKILNEEYDIPLEKIQLVHHGIPNTSLLPTASFKKKLRLENKIVLSTFGLISRGKGFEYIIKSLPNLVKKYPNIIYLIIGETHPVIRRQEGEKYRNELLQLVNELGLKNHVKFYNKYSTLPELIQNILATDIYICTNLDPDQIVSGTLSYALGCGKAIISTPSIYAKEILSNERGLLTIFKDPDSYENAINQILSNPTLKSKLEKNAYFFGRSMSWPNVASKYLNIFNNITNLKEKTIEYLPQIKLNYLRKLTDNFGCIQFSNLSNPEKKSGYTVDDNARALIAATNHYNLFKSHQSLTLIKIYLKFLERAQAKNGHFLNNFLNENELLDPCSEDAIGRAVWALGYLIHKCEIEEIVTKAKEMFTISYRLLEKLTQLRARAFAIIGLYHYNKKFPNNSNIKKIQLIANEIIQCYTKEASNKWHWFEPKITYSNSKLPEALFLAYELTKNEEYLKIAKESLEFLEEIVIIDGKLYPIGQNGWFNKNGKRAFFDQQPVDASCMVQTFLTAFIVTKEKSYYKKALLSFNWFLGKNYLGRTMYDPLTGGCYDGLSKESINLNQGAESTTSYLIARLMLEEIRTNKRKNKH